MNQEVASWPYEFALSKDYIKSNQRGTVRGQLFVNDRYIFFTYEYYTDHVIIVIIISIC